MVRVAINGFGRIGRMVLRAALKVKGVDVVAVNDLTEPNTLAYLLKYDSVHGTMAEKVSVQKDCLVVGSKKILVLSEKEPQLLPWKQLRVDIVVESTGFFTSKSGAAKHLEAGAKRVLISANYKGDEPIKTLIKGVNHSIYNKKSDTIVCKGSCTTTCLSPMVKVLNDSVGVKQGFMVTTHGVTNSQRIADSPHRILREGRSVFNNVIPTKTGAATAVIRVLPELKGKLDGLAIRVPVPAGSIVDFTCVVGRKTSVEEVNRIFKRAAKSRMKGIVEYSEEELVSTDIIGNIHSTIFDSKLTRVEGNLVKVFGWYDNEYGYAHKIVEMVKFIG